MFSKEKPTAFLAEHVWEHMTLEDGIIAAKNCFDFIEDVAEKAEADSGYKEKLKSEHFGEVLIYMAEYLLKEIVESEECQVPDELVYAALDRWLMDRERRGTLLEVVSTVKHPQARSRNPFLESRFLTKDNLEKLDEDFKNLPAMAMFIKKYYVEPKAKTASKTTKKTSVPSKKPKEPTLFDMLSL